jgi:UDP-N-acetylmuramoylalanine--D-glutamate ligase
MDLKGKKVTVVGLARSGLSAAILLYRVGAEVSVTDSGNTEELRRNAEELRRKNIEVELGGHSLNFIKGRSLVVLSPGVRDDSPVVIWARCEKIPIISEIELAWVFCPAPVVAITGTNGKTTVTTLIGDVLRETGKRVWVCGNIGQAFSNYCLDVTQEDLVCLEVSSFQLERIINFKPKVSVVLNFTPDHLDRYKDMREYLEAKKRIFINQDETDWTVLNHDDPQVRGLAHQTKAKVIYFQTPDTKHPACPADRQTSNTLNANHLAVMSVGSIFGVSQEAMLKVFGNFRGIEHRLEYVVTINGVRFINDSKSTNVDSTTWALNNCAGPIILIAGGRDKGADFGLIRNLIKDKVKTIILIGEAKDKIKRALEGTSDIENCNSLEEAVALAYSRAEKGDSILLSPMCASFDMFKDFEERGRAFKEAVKALGK